MAYSREYNLPQSNRAKPNMHKINPSHQTLADRTNYLCNNKTEETMSHVAAYLCVSQSRFLGYKKLDK